MCGIVGYVGNKRNAYSTVLDGLKTLEYRGYDSSGIAWLDIAHWGHVIWTNKSVGKIVDGLANLIAPDNTQLAIGHTRWATHGGVTYSNTHPHWSYDDSISIVHNGIIDNYEELKIWLAAQKIVCQSETDSEVIAHLIAYYTYHSNMEEAFKLALSRLRGTYAIAAISNKYPDKLWIARNGSPLVIAVGDTENWVASDANAIRDTNRIIYVEDGDSYVVSSNSIKSLGQSIPQIHLLDRENEKLELGRFQHFMLKEIWEQPAAVQRCFGGRLREDGAILGGISLTPEQIANLSSITFIGCGTSYHAALAAKPLFEKYCQVPCRVEIASEFLSLPPIIDRNGLYFVISQSGETFDTIECVKEIQRKGAKVYGVINVVGSTIARLCGAGVYIHAGPEIAVASTKAFTAQLAALYMLVAMLGRSKAMSKERGSEFIESLRSIPAHMTTLLESIDVGVVQSIVSRLSMASHTLFLGRGLNWPNAFEGALKLKEIAYIPSDSYAGGEMKHGPIALIKKGTPVIAITPQDKWYERMAANIKEVEARGAEVIRVGTDEKSNIRIPSLDEEFYSFLTIIPLQLLAYYTAVHLSYDVDRPRNLAKCVTTS